MCPWWKSDDPKTRVRFYLGDVLSVLKRLRTGLVQMSICSPPYWALRDYGTGSWEGGDPKCNHSMGRHNTNWDNRHGMKRKCKKCGARRVDHQLGSEDIPDCKQRHGNCAEKDWENGCFICRMVLVFREVRRVLRDDGVCLINIGDSYSSGGRGGGGKQRTNKGSLLGPKKTKGLAPGNLVGVPWRLALAMQEDGWVLRNDIIWHKPNQMPESVYNRCSRAHEYIFMFTKSMKYYYDSEAVREFSDEWSESGNKERKHGIDVDCPNGTHSDLDRSIPWLGNSRNKRTVWIINSTGIGADHFASFPKKLPETCILATTSAKGCCAKCGRCWVRIVEKDRKATRPAKEGKMIGKDADLETGNRDPERHVTESRTVGWRPDCECHGKLIRKKIKYMGYGDYHPPEIKSTYRGTGYGLRSGKDNGPKTNPVPNKELEKWITEYESDLPLDEHPIKSCTVLDPFIGSGTTSLVAQSLGCRSIGIDLSEKYLKMAKKRIESRGIIGKKRKPEPDDLFVFGDD